MERVRDEGIKELERYRDLPDVTAGSLEAAVQYVLEKIDNNLAVFAAKFPAPCSRNNIYPAIDNIEWTSSFWTGMLWLAYEITGRECYRQTAEAQLASYAKRINDKTATDTHDLGFLYSLSCVAAYKLTGNELAKQTALKAANLLINRYFEKARIIQAWGNLNDPNQRGRMIIDCCMNLPLLYWASIMTGDARYFNIAFNHARQAATYLIREDASTYHTFYMNVDTGEPLYGKTAQGYADNSCWARGQAWAIYGFPLSYIYAHDPELIAINKKLCNYFLNRLPQDEICYWDLIFTGGPEERDSSAAAIAVCGLLETAKRLPLSDPYRRIYENAALKILKSLIENYTTKNVPESNGLLVHGVYSKPGNLGVDECCIWGDYFYFEALVRVLKHWRLYW